MKLNKILMAIAATAMVGCSSDDFMDFSANQAPEDSRMIQLDENFALAGVSVDDATTRTHWYNGGGTLKNMFLPRWASNTTEDNTIADHADLLDQAVGLCWLGEGTVGEKVFTNYQFYHYGWLNAGESDADFECAHLLNGALYNEITVYGTGTAEKEAKDADFKGWTVEAAAYKTTTLAALNYNSGIYKTDNKAIFGGKYIVYYPFDEDFKEIGTIPAKGKTSFNPVSTKIDDPALGDATFRYSAPVTIEGGAQAGGFGMYNLSALANLNVTTTSGTHTIDRIVLWSQKEQLLQQANLRADKIVAGKKGTELYAEGSEVGTKTIVATLDAPFDVKPTASLSAFIAVLPTTVEDLVAYVHRTDKKWAKIDLGKVTFEPNSGKLVSIPVKEGNFQVQYIAVDYASLVAALGEAAGTSATIEVIGDITLEADMTINEPNITIKGDKIIVPQDVTLTLNTKMESDIDLLGTTCCDGGTNGAKLIVQGGTISNVTMLENEKKDKAIEKNPTVEFNTAASTVAAGKKLDAQAGTIKVDAAVSHKADINIAEGVTVTVSETGDLNFMGAKVLNNGTIEVKKEGKFDITDKDGNATATDGKNMTNNGLFIHNVDAAVGTAVQLMQQNGVYRCRVNKQIKLDDAYQKWLACSVIEMVEGGQVYDLGVAEKNINYKHNGKFIDIEVNTTSVTTFTNPDLGAGDGDNKNIQVGKLTVLQGGLYVPFVKGEGKRELTVNGDMTVSVTSSLYTSKKITVKENLIVNNGATLKYAGKKQNEGGLAVEKDIKVSAATFDASIDKVDALDITCANFTLADAATAIFGNRTEGDTSNMKVSGTITNPDGCTFNILAANQVGGSILATITCKKLIVGGNWGDGGKPQVVE